MLDPALIDSLFPAELPEPAQWEERYPPRSLPAGAEVTRFGPSPTGFVHIGGLYVATIDRDVATHSGGVYIVRVEDTDQAREVAGALAQFDRAPSRTSTSRPTRPTGTARTARTTSRRASGST